MEQQEHFKIQVNGKYVTATPQLEVQALNPKNPRDLNTVDKINDWDYRNKKSLPHPDADPESLSGKMKDCNLNEVSPHKRYEHCRSKLSTSQSSTSTMMTSRIDNSSIVSSEDSYHSATPTVGQKVSTPQSQFQIALQQENRFSTTQRGSVLMHCKDDTYVAPSISSLSEANFPDNIHKQMKEMMKDDVYRTQSVGWNNLMRRNSLILINAARSGKTWTYLPAVCSLLWELHLDNNIEPGDGPVMLIICLDSSSVNFVKEKCLQLLSNKELSCVAYVSNAPGGTYDFQIKMLNGMHILVTNIPTLLRLMDNPLQLFKKTRIQTIVFDEIDSMCDRFGESEVDKIYKSFCAETNIQTIVTSKTWRIYLKNFCKKEKMLLCIGAYIEAAIYSSIDITLESIDEKDRYRQFVSYFKKGNYTKEPTVIICSKPEEVLSLAKILENDPNLDITYCHDKTDSSVIGDINRKIKENQTHKLGVLVCTDDVLGDLVVRDAQHIIHFSLPEESWTKFTQRFVASLGYYEGLVQDRLSAGRPTSVVFVDINDDALPRLIGFMRTRCGADVPKSVLSWVESKRIEREENGLMKYKPFCDSMLLFGNCLSQFTCVNRHVITKFDRPIESIPRSGYIKFQVHQTNSPAHFTVRLLEHRTLDGKWQKMPHVDDYFSFQRNFDEYFKNPDNHQTHLPELGDLCVIEGENETFKRCKIIGINKRKPSSSPIIKLLLIDSNKTDECNKPTDLLVLPEKFKRFPPLVVDIRIAGVAPLDLSTTWDKGAKDLVNEWLKKYDNCEVQGKIKLTVMNCIWVKTVEIVKRLASINEEVVKVNVKKRLIKEDLAMADEKSFEVLEEMVRKAGIFDTEPCAPGILDPDLCVSPLVKAQERGRGRGKVISNSSNESVHSINRSFAKKDKSSNSSHCSLISSGSEGLTRPNYQNSVSPHDRICVPQEQWATLPDTYNEVEIGEFYSPARFYVLLVSTNRSFDALWQQLCEFASDSKNLKPLVTTEVGQICLANVKGGSDYRRAKILNVNEETVDIFLVDYGVKEIDVPRSDLIEIPEKFISALPFQAILCKMVGIRPANESEKWSDEACREIYEIVSHCEQLFVLSTGIRSVTDDTVKCNAYDVIYLEPWTRRNINQLVESKGIAALDPESKHLIDFIVDWNLLTNSSATDAYDTDSWDSDDVNEDIYDAGTYLSKNLEFINQDSDGSDKEFDIQFDDDQIRELMCQMLDVPVGSNVVTEDNQLVLAPSNTTSQDISAAKTESLPKASAEIRERFTEEKDKLDAIMNNQLVQLAKIPHIVWKQSAPMVIMAISAPDVTKYSLKVGSRYVHFCFIHNNEKYESFLNLFGCIDSEYTSHEIRGLNVIVRLRKTLAGMEWPRLVQSPDKNRFIKYEINAIDIDDEDSGNGDEYLPRPKNDSFSSIESDDDDVIDDVEL